MTGNSSLAQSQVSHDYAVAYQNEVQKLFDSDLFKESTVSEKRDQIGNVIFKHVEKVIGSDKAPKITGMLIDLPDLELNYSISNWVNFYTKVMSAFNLIQ